MHYPKISVITVVLNREDTLERTIKSVLCQNYDNIEYIIVDGASTDGTIDIIKKFANNISEWISEKDKGIYDAMNKGIAFATGDIIAFLNSDDWYLDNALSYVASQFIQKDCDICFCGVTRQTEDGKNINRFPGIREYEKVYKRLAVYHPATFAKKRIFNEIGDFNIGYQIAADYDWLVRMKNYGYIMRFADFVTTYYSDGGISSTYWNKAQKEAEQIDLRYARDKKEQKVIISFYKNNRCSARYSELLMCEQPCFICSEEMKQYLSEKVYIFGAGIMAKECRKLLWHNGIQIKGYIDNNKARWNECFENSSIFSPEILKSGQEMIVISSIQYKDEIKQQLYQMGIQSERIVGYDFLKSIVWDKIISEEV